MDTAMNDAKRQQNIKNLQTLLTDLGDQLPGEDALVEPLPDLRQHPLAHPPAHGVANHPLLVAQQRVEIQRVVGSERCLRDA